MTEVQGRMSELITRIPHPPELLCTQMLNTAAWCVARKRGHREGGTADAPSHRGHRARPRRADLRPLTARRRARRRRAIRVRRRAPLAAPRPKRSPAATCSSISSVEPHTPRRPRRAPPRRRRSRRRPRCTLTPAASARSWSRVGSRGQAAVDAQDLHRDRLLDDADDVRDAPRDALEGSTGDMAGGARSGRRSLPARPASTTARRRPPARGAP